MANAKKTPVSLAGDVKVDVGIVVMLHRRAALADSVDLHRRAVLVPDLAQLPRDLKADSADPHLRAASAGSEALADVQERAASSIAEVTFDSRCGSP